MIAFFTVQIDFPVDADPGLLALAYAVSIAEEPHPAANEFEEQEKLVNHYNDCVTTRKRFLDMLELGRFELSLRVGKKFFAIKILKMSCWL